LTPSGRKDWWTELPPSGETAWAERAQRRKGKVTFRLAFICNKFRLGIEPDPFCLELHLPPDGLWTVADVTASLIAAREEAKDAASEAKRAQLDAAAHRLAELVSTQAGKGEPLKESHLIRAKPRPTCEKKILPEPMPASSSNSIPGHSERFPPARAKVVHNG
jgi:hypothetical protein